MLASLSSGAEEAWSEESRSRGGGGGGGGGGRGAGPLVGIKSGIVSGERFVTAPQVSVFVLLYL